MVVLGFLSNLIESVDGTIKFIIELKQVPEQVDGLLEDLEASRTHLEGLKEMLQKYPHSTDSLVERISDLQVDLHEILNDSINLLKRFHPSAASNSGFLPNFRQSIRWVVDRRYQGTVKALQERISKIEKRIDRLLLLRISQSSQSQQGQELCDPPAPMARAPAATLPPSPTEYTEPIPPLQTRSPTISTDATYVPQTNGIYSAMPIRRASTLPYTPPPFTQEILSRTGTIKVWFEAGNPNRLQSHKIERVAILRDGAGCFRGIKMTRPDGRILTEEISPFWSNVAKHPLPVHQRRTGNARDSDGLARNCIRFLHDKRSPSIPKYYSFSSDEDYRAFQSKIVGKSLLFWAEVQSISSAWSKTPLSEYQIVQLWQSNGIKIVQFFRNGKDNVYSQHSMASLRMDKSSSNELKLIFASSEKTPPPGTVLEQEQIMKYLSIKFTNPKDKDEFLRIARLRG